MKYETIQIKKGCWIKQHPFVGNDGIYIPVHEYAEEGTESAFRCIITKEIFVEAYNRWIKEEEIKNKD